MGEYTVPSPRPCCPYPPCNKEEPRSPGKADKRRASRKVSRLSHKLLMWCTPQRTLTTKKMLCSGAVFHRPPKWLVPRVSLERTSKFLKSRGLVETAPHPVASSLFPLQVSFVRGGQVPIHERSGGRVHIRDGPPAAGSKTHPVTTPPPPLPPLPPSSPERQTTTKDTHPERPRQGPVKKPT